MRLRNVKNAKEIINKSSYITTKPSFHNSNPIDIEIGMGKGKFIKEMALENPNVNYVGIEKYDSVIIRAIQKLEGLDISNLKLIVADACNIDKIFKENVRTLYLNFSDPWPKKRHSNRRLTSPVFLEKYEHIFKENPHIIMKTDNRNLFEYSLISFSNFGYIIKNISLDLHSSDISFNVETEYETKFKMLGKPIYMVEVVKNRH